jgi:hypothetical protein
MEMTTALSAPSAGAYRPPVTERVLRNRLVLSGLAVTVIAAGLAWQWSWLVAIGVAPVLLSVAPCAVMCALGICMMGKVGGSCNATKVETSGEIQRASAD